MNQKIIDISNFWLPTPVIDDMARELMRTAKTIYGVQRVIAGTQVPSICYQQLDAALSEGLAIDAYVQFAAEEAIEPQFDGQTGARWAVGALPIKTLWITVEEQDFIIDYRAKLAEAIKVAKANGFRDLGIYTNQNNWLSQMGDTLDYRSYKLWWASYGLPDTLRAPAWRSGGFGGWWKPALRQYSQNMLLAGMNVDYNVAAS